MGSYDFWRDPHMNLGPSPMFLILGTISLTIWITKRLS